MYESDGEIENLKIKECVEKSMYSWTIKVAYFIYSLIIIYLLVKTYFNGSEIYNWILIAAVTLILIYMWASEFLYYLRIKRRCRKSTSLNKEEFNEKWNEIKNILKEG